MSVHIQRLQELVPDFTIIWWRVVKMKINLGPKVNIERDDIVIAVDSTGIKVTNREENEYLINGRRIKEREKVLSKFMLL
jgi:hypothetical protein